MEKQIEACPFCLSRDIDYTPGDGYAILTIYAITAPQAGRAVCKNCGKMMLPILFKNEADYKDAKKSMPAVVVKESARKERKDEKIFISFWDDEVSKKLERKKNASASTLWMIMNAARAVIFISFAFAVASGLAARIFSQIPAFNRLFAITGILAGIGFVLAGLCYWLFSAFLAYSLKDGKWAWANLLFGSLVGMPIVGAFFIPGLEHNSFMLLPFSLLSVPFIYRFLAGRRINEAS